MIVITRSDLSFGYKVVMSTHSIADFAFEYPEVFRKWKNESNSIICLSATSEDHLLELYDKYSIITPAVKFYEPDVDQVTSICLYGSSEIRKSLSNLPLIKNKSIVS